MLKIPFGELKEARDNPLAYRAKLLNPELESGPHFGFANVLLNAVHEFNKTGNETAARNYLSANLERFKNSRKKAETESKLEWYIEETNALGNVVVKSRQKLSIALPARVQNNIRCSGEISRIDVVPAGGYAAWLVKNKSTENWDNDIQMPLLQREVSKLLGVTYGEVSIGLYSFSDKLVVSKSFGRFGIRRAEKQLDTLLLSLGY
jgi:hypothetical protein